MSEIEKDAYFSEDRVYRYYLTRTWDTSLQKIAFCLLNPSTADEIVNDPTIERCQRRAKMMGFGGMIIVNLFAYRSTDPRNLFKHEHPVGPANDGFIIKALKASKMFICGWGQHGSLGQRDKEVLALLKEYGRYAHVLKLNKDGTPAHPLYLKYDLQPVRFV